MTAWTWKRLLFAAVALIAVVWPAMSFAAGGSYTVVQCDSLNRASNEATFDPSTYYTARPLCGEPEQDFAVKIDNVSGTPKGHKGRVYWEAPAGTSIVGVKAEVKLRNGKGHRARVFIADSKGREVERILNGDASPTGWKHIDWKASGVGHERFTITLSCEGDDVCPQSDLAKAWVREVRIKVADGVNPVLGRIGGSLFGGGWLRGEQGVVFSGSDSQSGIERLTVNVGASPLRSFGVACAGALAQNGLTKRFVPCPVSTPASSEVKTSESLLHDGANQLDVCAEDFASNMTCQRRRVLIDNSPPRLAFPSAQDRDDPERISVSATDEASGLASGEIYFRLKGTEQWRPLATTINSDGLVARVDSASEPSGSYEFLARATDVAGNAAATWLRADGAPMVLNFPLRSGVHLQAQLEPGGSKRKTVGYRRPGHVGGKLLTAAGVPLKHRKVTVVEHFGDGALLAKRRRKVKSDGHGNWSERVPPGPSRRITASYAGDQRYLPTRKRAGRLYVKSRARFRISRHSVREGRPVVFSGKVKHLGAHIPPGGKLVELQVRERPGRWNTVREAFYTNGSGKYKIRYRFGKFYVRNTRFRFRVKVAREQGWPYKAPVRSRKRVVVVRAHR